jgi:hypothetical protein
MFVLGWMTGRKTRNDWAITRMEPAAAAVVHPSGAVNLARDPGPAPERLPESVGERIRTVTLQIPPCETVREIQLDIMQTVDGDHRVTVGGFPGITGTDFSLSRAVERRRMWEIGAFADSEGAGPMVGYRLDRLRVWTGYNIRSKNAMLGLTFSF